MVLTFIMVVYALLVPRLTNCLHKFPAPIHLTYPLALYQAIGNKGGESAPVLGWKEISTV
jgi:hypothetical protein